MQKPEATVYVTERDLNKIRRRIDRVLQMQGRTGHQQGWSQYSSAPIQVGKALRYLKQKKDVALYAYQYISGENGNAFVFALPEGVPFPEPADCMVESEEKSGVEFSVPTPPGALACFMDAFERPTTVEGYIEASLLMRALQEFGAMWHGYDWGCETIIDAHPNDFAFNPKSTFESSNTPRDRWVWSAPVPNDWRGMVQMAEDGTVHFRFYTWSPVGVESIYEVLDSNSNNTAAPQTQVTCIAQGCEGIIF